MSIRLPRPVTQQALAIALTGLSSIAWLPVIGAPYLRFAVTLLAAAVWIVVWACGGVERLGRSHRLLYMGLGLAIAAVVVSSALSRFPAVAFTYGGTAGVSAPYWISLLVIMGMSARVTLSRSTVNAIRWQFAWAIPVAVIGIAQALVTGHISIGFSNVDLFSPMMLLFAPVALGLAVMSPERAPLWRIAAAVFVAAVLSARTLSGLVGLSAEIFFLVLFAPGLLGLRGRMRIVLASVLVMLITLFLLFGVLYRADALPKPAERFVTSTVLGASASTRIEMWRAGLQEWRGHLLTGVGPDEYAYEGQRFFSHQLHVLEHHDDPDNVLPMDPHSLILLLPVDFGLLGVLAMLVIWVAWAVGVMRPPFRSTEGHLLRWGFALGALGFGYTSLFVPFALQFGGLPLLISGLALVRAPSPRPWREAARYSAPRVATAVAAVMVAIAIGGGAVVGWALFSTSSIAVGDDSGLSRAARIQPQVAYYRYALLWQRGRLLARSPEPNAHLVFHRAVDSASRDVRGYAPYIVELVRLSLVDALRTGRTDVSWERTRLAEARAISPNLPETAVELVHLELALGHYVHARQRLNEAAEWRDVVPEYRQYEAMVEARTP